MKKCRKCSKKKSRKEFHKNRSKRDGLRDICRKCARAYHRKHYLRNKDYYVDRARLYTRRQVQWMHSFKNKPCRDCGKKYPPWVMHFDHVRGKKIGDVAKLARNNSRKAIRKEISKCEVVCANCHAERTHQRSLRA